VKPSILPTGALFCRVWCGDGQQVMMTARFAAATANGQVIGITGQDPVPRLGQQDDAGIDRVAVSA
jgi:hypothetical protein